MKPQLYITFFLFFVISCQSQTDKKTKQIVGGPCEGCEALYEYEGRILNATDTLPKFEETEPKLHVTGTVYHKDSQTPAKGVILYIYHTNRQGVYETKGGEKGWARRHGYIRGWVVTGKDGQYSFFTFRPAAYPDGREPEHIHMIVKEPTKNEYYIDNIMFLDDPLLGNAVEKELENRGGSGLVRPFLVNDNWTVKRDIVLGKNIPYYE